MSVLVACKNEEDPIKNEGARVVTTLFIDCSYTQGQQRFSNYKSMGIFPNAQG